MLFHFLDRLCIFIHKCQISNGATVAIKADAAPKLPHYALTR